MASTDKTRRICFFLPYISIIFWNHLYIIFLFDLRIHEEYEMLIEMLNATIFNFRPAWIKFIQC